MRECLMIFWLIVAFIFSGCPVSRQMPPAMAVYGPRSDFIFKGELRILHTSTIDSPDAETMGVVRVVEVIKSPPNLRDLRGQDVTVRFFDIDAMSARKEIILFTTIAVLGNEVAVTEVGNMPADDTRYPVESLRTDAAQAMQIDNEEKLRALVSGSELIVFGTVARTTLLESERTRDSEHDPMWTEAIVQVDETIKGNADQTASFVFAASTDVAWYQYPKFRKGDRGVFLLRRQEDKTQMRDRLALMDKTEFRIDKETIGKIRKYAK